MARTVGYTSLVGKYYLYSPEDLENEGMLMAAGRIIAQVAEQYYLITLEMHPRSEAPAEPRKAVQLVTNLDYLMRLWLYDNQAEWQQEWDEIVDNELREEEAVAAALEAETNKPH